MSAFTSAAQGDNCCGQRKNSFNLPKTFHDFCSWGVILVEVESTRIWKGFTEVHEQSSTTGDHTLSVIPQVITIYSVGRVSTPK